MKKQIYMIGLLSALATALGSGCNSTPSTPGVCTNCSAITPENFVSALVSLAQSGQIPSAYATSTLAKATSLQSGYFIIWDGATQAYEAVNISNVPTSAECAENGATCSNLNPTAAAEGFVNATGENHTTTGVSNEGAVTVVNGTQFGASFGSYNFIEPGTGPGTDSELWWETGSPSMNYFPVTPDNNVIAPTGGQVYQDTYGDGLLYSQNGQTRDTDLQQANLQQASLAQRAAMISANFQMDFSKAIQLTTLSDKLNAVKAGGQSLTDDDRAAIMHTLSGIAGVSQDQLTAAVTQGLQGNNQPAQDLVDAISKNLGMPNSATLRDQILPRLGLNLN